MQPRVSVILTVYKRTTFLREAIDSVLAQTFSDFEVLVADDSGAALSREVVESYEDPRIRFRPNPVTLGVATSVRGAIKQASGEFIIIINDDDSWEPTLLAELIAPLVANPNVVASFADHWLMQEDGAIDHARSDRFSHEFRRDVLPHGIVSDPALIAVVYHAVPINISTLFRKNALNLDLIVPEVTGAYDYWISCVLAACGRPFYYVSRRLARWRLHSAMETKRRSHDKGENLVYIFSYMRKQNWFRQIDDALRRELAEAALVVGRDKMQFGRSKEARRHFWLYFTNSFHPRGLVLSLFSFLPSSLRNSIRSRKEKLMPSDAKGKENSLV